MSLYDKASIALIPSGTKASTLYSVLPANGDGDFTHSRSLTTATRVNKDGLIESVAANVPRLDYPLTNGIVGDCPHLLLEPQRTNISPDSERMDLWSSLRTTETINSGVSPDGANTAVKVAMTATTGEHSVYDGVSVTSGTDYTNSIFIKKGTGSSNWQYFQFRFRNGGFGTGGGVVVDIHNGTITYNSGLDDYGIENYGNGWYRVFITQTATATSSSAGPVLAFNEISNGFDVNIVGNTNADVLLWGSQFEAGSFKTSYIPTSGSQVTRSADVCNGSGTSAEFNDSEGVLFAEIAAFDNNVGNARITINKASAGSSERVGVGFTNTTNQIQAFISRSSTQVNILATISDIRDFNKIAFKYKVDDFSLFINGTKVGTDTLGSVPIGLDELSFDDNDGVIFYGKCKQLMVFNEALSDSELATLTS